METVIVIRTNEIFLKGGNKKFFINTLLNNIKKSLKGFKNKISTSQNRLYVSDYYKKDQKEIIKQLKTVFGIYSISVAYKLDTDFENIKKAVATLVPKRGTFRMEVKRADKTFSKNSMELARELGGLVLEKNPKLKVSLKDPQTTIYVDIRENKKTYVYKDIIYCRKGLPVGTAGHSLLLLSGGIDSPVAGYQIAKRGMKLSYIHFCSPPYTSELAKEKVIKLARILSKYTQGEDLYIVNFTKLQLKIQAKCKKEYTITIMRRLMVKIAEMLAKKINAQALVTGESLGQVASQTVESLSSTQNAVNDIIILRPLISFDKEEIIEIAKEIESYETSILDYEDCCTLFVPKHPVISPNIKLVKEEEKKIDNLQELLNEALEEIEIIKI